MTSLFSAHWLGISRHKFKLHVIAWFTSISASVYQKHSLHANNSIRRVIPVCMYWVQNIHSMWKWSAFSFPQKARKYKNVWHVHAIAKSFKSHIAPLDRIDFAFIIFFLFWSQTFTHSGHKYEFIYSYLCACRAVKSHFHSMLNLVKQRMIKNGYIFITVHKSQVQSCRF